ncbi:hypothetical protein [Atlantibacter hermannii]|uniref:hypothetical protein n=1 Tax=Atlantibacter hermannii TaxID=565 RepID=UPI0028AE1816|nr:hypothetical protein [Atlantibacter hermannii]MCQ4969187.1 hypothetical protein [Enterobacteriaceae bacterium DFI.7.85]
MSWNEKKPGNNSGAAKPQQRDGKVTSNEENPPFDLRGRMPPGKVVTESRDSDKSKKNR